MPHWIRRYICHYLAWLLRMKRPNEEISWKVISCLQNLVILKRSEQNSEAKESKITDNESEPLLSQELVPGNTSEQPQTYENKSNLKEIKQLKVELQRIFKEICVITDDIRQRGKDDNIASDWKFAAMVIERFCLWLFTFLTIVFTCSILFSSPNIFKLY
ncbi:unnamed protein product [Didymodactylos carnosus]|uniref:Neurotransmitter-gated ion-channel transmembrane domain-containing protein n=1 Tax=Didymodactylos carnosus TaxID=1234261 RepID=A0A815A4F9_9BILA|nr:unnamed protein product [Didymodactylos carnosus]CAF1337155.1 unnamed protein product [Didymodactylos carnosus]CAF4020382.1 unnamed protein product [Didymodactylos carnosus]CAF4148395.1 unnamed protein product [Didymodactylos carnosus]